MKSKIFANVMFAALIILTSFACHPEEVTSTEVGTIKATIDGESFKSTGAFGAIVSDSLVPSEIFTISGANLQLSSLIISFTGEMLNLTEKTYNQNGDVDDCTGTNGSPCVGLGFSKTNLIAGTQDDWSNTHPSSKVKVVITDIDYQVGGSVKGTFEGTLYDSSVDAQSVEVKNGSFNVKIQ